MLKIKDSVDLKELEKFGFKFTYDPTTGDFEYAEKKIILGIPKHSYLLGIDKNRKLELFIYTNYALQGISSNIDDMLLDNIYDLIKADMVEKVEE